MHETTLGMMVLKLRPILAPLLVILVAQVTFITTAHAKETLSVLSLNVAGLPEIFTDQDSPEARMLSISQRAKDWDLVAYQEDFAFSEWLDDQDEFETVLRGTKFHALALVCPWLRKSGLTLKTNLPTSNTQFHKYNKCTGYFGKGSDCWVSKGFLCTRVLTPKGLLIDFCTTHMNAGNDVKSHRARRSQIRQYQAGIPPFVTDQPWIRIETGDYNLRTINADIEPLLKGRSVVVANDTGLGKNVDYITVLTNGLVKVTLKRHGKVPQFEGLSDHPAIGAVLELDY